MKILTTSKVADLDRYTIANEPIEAIDLMERASLQLAGWLSDHLNTFQRIAVFAGTGNNGGDALAVSRMLAAKNFRIDVFIPGSGRSFSDCFLINLSRLNELVTDRISVITLNWNSLGYLPDLIDYDFIIDGLFGTGLKGPLSGFAGHLVKHLNNSGVPVISIDIPSGLMGEDNRGNDHSSIVEASHTLTFQFPKLSFFFKENERFTGKWEVLPIGLHPAGIDKTKTPWHYSDLKTAVSILKTRGKFSHKGIFGHALLIAGSYGKIGASVLAAKGCLRSGVGLLTVHLPKCGNQIMQTAVPEAMISADESENIISSIPQPDNYKAIGVGPGIGKAAGTLMALRFLFENFHGPLVVDADAINILSENPELIKLLPSETILTPHPVEFGRLAGHAGSDFERITLAVDFAKIHDVILIIKGAYTAVAFPDGNCWFNSTGNPGMATGGSGDVLTGILTGLLAQGYSPREAALLGVYVHGLAGDLYLRASSEEALIAGDLADNLGKAFALLKSDPDFGNPKKESILEVIKIMIFKTENIMMKRVTILLFSSLLIAGPLTAQRKDDKKKSSELGVFPGGIIYSLPRTGIRIIAEVSQEKFYHGPYGEFAQKYIGVKNAPASDAELWKINDIKLETFGEPDPAEVHKASGPVASMLSLTDDGILIGMNSTVKGEDGKPETSVFTQAVVIPREIWPEMSMHTLLVGKDSARQAGDKLKSFEEKAAEAAHDIMKLRKRKALVLAADYDKLPPDGKAYQIMVDELNKIIGDYESLFIGKSYKAIHKYVFEVVPDAKGSKAIVAFRFSPANGVLPESNVSGKPIMLELEPNSDLVRNSGQKATLEAGETSGNGMFYRIPGIVVARLLNGSDILAQARLSMAQFGVVSPIPDGMTNGEYSIEFHPVTGAIKHVGN